MAKKILQDIVTSSNSIKTDIRRNATARGEFKKHSINIKNTKEFEQKPESRSDLHESSRFVIWSIAAGVTIFFLFVLLSFFSGTVVEVSPLQKIVTIDENFTANKKSEENILSFKLVVLENSFSKEIPATIEKELNRKASGNIMIYNAYSSKSQKLVKRTRFETPDGKIYRIDKPVVVPGTTVQEGKIIPGSVEVVVYADIPGEEYNIELTDFTIPGFKGDPRFEKFYARSKTSMIGGFSGIVKTASADDIKKVREDLQNSLKETLLSQAQIPGDFILYDDAVFFTFDVSDTQTETTKNSTEITEVGKLYGVIFNKDELSKHIAQNTIASYRGSDVIVQKLEDLEFSFLDKNDFNPTESETIDFNLSGSTSVIWKIDEIKLAADLAGRDKQDFLSIIEQYPNIQTFKATIRPFWKKTFPENSEDITISKNSYF